MTTTGSQVYSFDPNDPEAKDLAFDGTHVWMINSFGAIKKYTTGGTLVDSKAGVLNCGWGLTWEDGYLWASNPDDDMIYRIGLFDNISPDSVMDWIDSGADLVLLDVREQSEYESIGRIPGAINMPWNSGVLDTAYVHLSVGDEIIVYCGSGYRSALAAGFLGSKGFQHLYNMLGGFNAWQDTAEIGGHVCMNATWQTAKGTYLAVDDVTVDSLITLAIQAGVSVQFCDSCAFLVQGTWAAQGAKGGRVVITRSGFTGHVPITIEGTISAAHVDFEYFDSSGVNISPGAAIEKLDHISFRNDDVAGPNSFLQLTPTDDTLSALTFNGGTPGEDCNIRLNGSGTLSIYGYGGDFGGPDHDCPGDGQIVWLQAMPGDANGDWTIDLGDVIYVINYLFKGGSAPVPLEVADFNCDGSVELGDVIYLLNYLFKDGPPPGC
jgi:rhodanese-related sulfurtransferase